eukprot:5133649-Pyramimonas_sp.AAC.1
MGEGLEVGGCRLELPAKPALGQSGDRHLLAPSCARSPVRARDGRGPSVSRAEFLWGVDWFRGRVRLFQVANVAKGVGNPLPVLAWPPTVCQGVSEPKELFRD